MGNYCSACGVLVPVAKTFAGKGVGLVVAGVLGTQVRSWWGRGLLLLGSLAAGHLVDEIAAPYCARCGSPVLVT